MSADELRDQLHEQGYDKEAEYFRKKEKELLEKLRQKKEEEEAAKRPGRT